MVTLAPYVPSPPEVVKRMLTLARVGPNDVVYDLGCGDGRVLIMAVREFKARKAVGYEINRRLYETAVREVEKYGLSERIKIFNKDMFQADLSEATVIFLYLTTSANRKIRPKIEREALPGTRVVSHDFPVEGWRATVKENYRSREALYGHTIYLYTLPYAYTADRERRGGGRLLRW